MAIFASSDIIEDGLVAYWDANSLKSYPRSGTTWFDVVGENHATLTNSPDYTSNLKNSAVYFNGINSHAIHYGNHVLNFGSSNWTVEAFVYFNAMPTSDTWPTNYSNTMTLIAVGTASAGDGFNCLVGQTKMFVQNNDTAYISAVNHGMTTGQWYHIAYVRNGNTIFFYVDGVEKGSVSFSLSLGTGAATWIGTETNQGSYFNGYIKDLHVMTTAYYTAAFTRPITITKNSFTKLLTCQGSLDDASDNYFYISQFGATSSPISAFTFNGSTQYGIVNVRASSNTVISALTISSWFMKLTDSSGWQGIITRNLNAGNDNRYFFGMNNNNYRFYLTTSAGQPILTGPTVPKHEWINFVATWDGTNVRCYANGELIPSMNGSVGGTITNATENITIGCDNNSGAYGECFGGLISNVMMYNRALSQNEIVKNYKTLSKRFYPVQIPRTYYSNRDISRNGLKLHLDATDPVSYPGTGTTWFDRSGNGINATLVGSPTFLGNCFDITSDSTYITVPNSTLNPRTNDFTYSAWVNIDSTDTYDTIFENGSWGDTLLFRYENSVRFGIWSESADRGYISWTPKLGKWANLVLRRESGTVTLFVNKSPMGLPFTMNLDINLANPTMFLMRSQHANGQWTDGRIAAFSVYDRALSQTEINQNYDSYVQRLS